MNQDGYTLTEMLAALLMIGLAIGGLAQVVRLIGSAQATASGRLQETRALRAAEGHLSALLSKGAPYQSSNRVFVGDARSMTFACGDPAPCSAVLGASGRGSELIVAEGGRERTFHLPFAGARFLYQGDTSGQAWPPEGPKQGLRAVHLVDAEQGFIFTSRIWKEQPAECAFDSISRDCREAAP